MQSQYGLFWELPLPSSSLPFPRCAACKDSTCGRVELTACPASHNYAISCQHAGLEKLPEMHKVDKDLSLSLDGLTISRANYAEVALAPLPPDPSFSLYLCPASVQVHFAYK